MINKSEKRLIPFCFFLENFSLKKSIEIMTKKYSNGYPDPDEPFTFPDLEGYYYGFTFSVLENTEIDGTGAAG